LTDLKKFSGRIAWLREQLNLTGEEFGKHCGVTKGYISRLESGGRANPSDEFLSQVGRQFGVSLEWLEKGVGDLPNIRQATKSLLEPAESTSHDGETMLQEQLTEVMRVFLRAVEVGSDEWLQFSGLLLESGVLSAEMKNKLILASNIAFNEKRKSLEMSTRCGPSRASS
jgi:transcriptional regulator with XRE-family HTH domain